MKNSQIFIEKKMIDGSEYHFKVKSNSDPNREYLVIKKDEIWDCNCVAGTMGVLCSHIKSKMKEVHEGSKCFYCGTTAWKAGLDRHHVRRRGRRPDLIKDDKNIMLLCREHHDKATTDRQFEENLIRIWDLRQKDG